MKKALSDGTPLTDTQWQIIQRIQGMYGKGQALEYVKNPLVWALYQVWKEVDKAESEE